MGKLGPKWIVGLIGGIGAGKTTVARRFAELGALVIDADKAGHEALLDPAVRATLIERFGLGILDGEGAIDRKQLGLVVFGDAAKRRALEEVVHPVIRNVFVEKIATAMADPGVPLIVLDAAVLLEAGWGDACDKVVFVDVPRARRLERLQGGRGWTEEELARREAAQLPLEEKRRRADVVLANGGDPDECARHVASLFEEWTSEQSETSGNRVRRAP